MLGKSCSLSKLSSKVLVGIEHLKKETEQFFGHWSGGDGKEF